MFRVTAQNITMVRVGVALIAITAVGVSAWFVSCMNASTRRPAEVSSKPALVPVTYESSSAVTEQKSGTQVSVVDTTTGAEQVQDASADSKKATTETKTTKHKQRAGHSRSAGKFPPPKLSASAPDLSYMTPRGQVEMWSGTTKKVISVPRGPKLAESTDSSFPY